MIRVSFVILALLSYWPGEASGQGLDGYVSFLGNVLPHVVFDGSEAQTISEIRIRLFAEHKRDLGQHLKLTVSGVGDLLLADRQQDDLTRDGIVRPQELHLEATWAKADLRIGFTRIVWGRLDEFLPTDVVNPQDLARFFLEGRTEGRMSNGMVRGRWIPSDRFTLEGIYVPVFRRGRFDQLSERTSPFNVAPQKFCTGDVCADIQRRMEEPPSQWRSAQGGARASVTTGRVDWALSAYRGFEPLPVYELDGNAASFPVLVIERFPRFTMVGGDFETVRGQWGVRGEAAVFVQRTLQWLDSPRMSRGRAIEAGLGVDRRAGDYRVSGNLVITRRWTIDGTETPAGSIDRTDATIVGALDRSFARETRRVRALTVYNPVDSTGFVRVTGDINVRDDVVFESSIGWFLGGGIDPLGRLDTRDFVYARLKVFF